MENYNQKIKNFAEGFKKFFSNLGKVAIIVTAMASGYATSEIYHRYTTSVKAHQMQEPRKSAETSAAINERGELMIIDRKTGTYQVFDNEVGKVIFDLYASKIYYTQNGAK
jgi:hypothetical protein